MSSETETKYQVPDFKSDDQRDAWIAENADYFTVVRHKARGNYERHEKGTMREAMELASSLMKEHNRPYIVYAVYGPYQAFVTALTPPNKVEQAGGNNE